VFSSILETRQQLPVFQHKMAILELLRQHNVVLVAGETGSGKSTQVPHFILEVINWCVFLYIWLQDHF